MPKAKEDTPERPKIYVTPLGARYVKADELFQSKRGQAQLAAMNRLAARMRRAARERGKSK